MTQAGGATEESPHVEELALLERVLMPLGEERCQQILEMVDTYLEHVSPILGACGFREDGDPLQELPQESAEQVTWQVGAASPIDPTRTVFAIFEWPEMGHCLVAYSFSAVALEGDDKVLARYYREKIYRPRYAWGPLTLEALYNDLTYHLDVAPETEPQGKNGKG